MEDTASAKVSLQQLRHFVALAEELSFTRAARRVGVGQQGLSASIQALERALGAELFVRSTRSVTPTEAGDALLEPVRHALADLERGIAAVSTLAQGRSSTVRLATTVSGDFELVSRAMAALHATHPGMAVVMSRGTSAANLAGLRHGELDAALVRTRPSALSGFRSDLLRVDELVAVVTSDDPLASFSGVRAADVATRDLVLFPRSSSPGLFDDLMAWLGGPTGHVIERPDEEMIIREVAAGGGVGFTTAARAQEVGAPDVRRCSLSPPLTSDLVVVHVEDACSPVLDPLVRALSLAARVAGPH